jgi:protein-S-isoprenylcysteine O-methyltransferase Ste14
MTNYNALPADVQHNRLDRSGFSRLVQVFGSMAVMGAVLFLSAGRLDWIAAWLYLGLNLFIVGTIGLYVAHRNPDVINERGKIGKNIKSWDKIIMLLYTFTMFGLFVVAGFDAVRFGWSSLNVAGQAVGVLGYVLSMAITYWAMLSNPFLATTVRIQEERGHQVATTGPYQVVRHPMYVGVILMWLSTALVLGSLWALVPAVFMALLFVVRTVLEDRLLQAELPGYAAYAQRVRRRLIPGVW